MMALVLTIGAIASPFATNVVRGIVDARRVRREGLGGTQDIVMWGIGINLMLLIGAAACWGVWLTNR